MASFVNALSRKKSMIDNEESKLARVLSLLDLTGLGVGSTLGLGVYVLAGAVAKTVAGPAVCISFLIAAIASAFAGLCYAEFAARVPKAGSAYVYSYVSVGEFVAYIIGWNLILEYVIGTASLARGLSNYVDALANYTMRNQLTEMYPIDVAFLAPYPDPLSFLFVIVVTVFLAIGVKESTTLNNVLTGLNLLTVITVIISGSLKADPKNWFIPKDQIPKNVENAGNGGFAPFGISGIMAGAAKCFFGFVGFDAIATTGEEARNPKKDIPLSIVISLVIIFCAYFGIAIVLTMMWPYYDQDADAPFPHVYDKVDWHVIKWIVTIGAIFALCTSLMGAMFPLPRVLYAMAKDGVLFTFLSQVNNKTKTPLIATIISGVLAGIMATVFDLQQLIDMMSIGTLLAYTIVGICVLILRYEDEKRYIAVSKLPNRPLQPKSFMSEFNSIFNLNMNKEPDSSTSAITKWTLTCYTITALIVCFSIKYANAYISFEYPFYLAVFIALVIVLVISLVIIGRQPVCNINLSFKVPWVPVIPCLSILINLYLMSELDLHTWIRFIIWLVMGFLIYFLYGITHSAERYRSITNVQTPSATVNLDNKNFVDVRNSDENVITKF
ncbi:hypothetical protein RN001_012536 [Aquatica leii]|uniref:Cationic amino acid transporter C-terminal domain-containing protein n=1 Tax=Aquatica leii TaxID=1421715 RepID=A0AAN7P380_9COLE|nr:hypothetical protein RN001_012536 [Aquatica leii]